MTDEEVKCPYEGCVRIFAAVRADAYHAHLDTHMICDAIMDAGIGIVEALEGEEVETEEVKEDEGEAEKPATHLNPEKPNFFKKKRNE
jgi:hypothetical protein